MTKKKTKNITPEQEWINNGIEVGLSKGSLIEAEESLRLRFTKRELEAIILMAWFSDPMKAMHKDLFEIKKALENLKK